MNYPHGTLLDVFLILFLSLEIKTLQNDCDCLGVQELGILCVGLSRESNRKSFRVCYKDPLFNPLKLVIRDSESLLSLDLSQDFKEGSLPTELLSEIQIVNNSQLRRIRLCDPERRSCESFLPRLQTIDLRNNLVADDLYPTSLFDIPSLQQIYLSGNPWSCFSKDNHNQSQHKLSWILSLFQRSLIRDSPACSKPKSNKWHQYHSTSRYHSSNVTLRHFLEFYQTLTERCPRDCQCLIININRPLLVKVSCVGLNLTRLPQDLPPNTSDLDVSFNKLESIHELRTNQNYQNLSKLRAVRNKIKSLGDLQGSQFMKNRPTTINVQNNSITYFDVDLLGPLLSDMRKKNFHGSVDFLFFGNPLDCNCKNLTKLQQFLYEYKLYLRDADLLACGEDQNPILIQIDYSRFCETSIDYMWIIITAESLLLILVLGRLTYDVIKYRRSGELPWLAQHMYLDCSYVGIRMSHLPSLLFRSCSRASTSGVDDEEEDSGDDDISKTSRTFILKDVFRPKRVSVIASSNGAHKNDNYQLGDSRI